MKPIIDHVQITVRDLAQAEIFYDRLMPLLGFDLKDKSKGKVDAHEFEVIEYVHPLLILGINSPRAIFMDDLVHRRKPGALHHLAFKAESRREIDEVYPKLLEIGADIVEPPKMYPEHGKDYYALFFKDMDGIKYEFVCEKRD